MAKWRCVGFGLAIMVLGSACSSSTKDKAGAGSGPKCTISNGGQIMYCYEFGAGYSDSNVGTLCDVNRGTVVGTRVSACPAGATVGTCTVSSSSGGTTYSYDQVFYASNSMTCEAAKQNCDGVNTYTNGEASSTFLGDGCGANTGAYAGVDGADAGTPSSTGKSSGTCVISSGTVTNNVPCGAVIAEMTAAGQTPYLIIDSDVSDIFEFMTYGVSPAAGTYTSDGSRQAVANLHDKSSHEWQMFDQFSGQPKMGSYTVTLTALTETTIVPTAMRTWTPHGSLDLVLDPSTLSGATGTVTVHIDF
jgi:hypothetical protein